MLSMLLQRRSIFYMYRLVKPNISEFKSIEDLEYDQRQTQLSLIQQINQQTLERNKLFTKDKFIASILNVPAENVQNIQKKCLNFTAVSPHSLRNYTLQQNYSDGKINQYPFLMEEVEPNLPDFNSIPMHFSYKRGVAVIPEYQTDKKIAYIFNLPEDFNTKQISEKIGLETIKQIKVEYCRLGLPAYAKIYFNSDEAVTNLVLNNKTFIQLGNRICYIKTHFDREKLELKNRRLVLQDLNEYNNDSENNLIIRLSEYGRVMHLDYPTFITRNVSLEQVKEHYNLNGKESGTLLKINVHRKDGTIDSEYYPSLQQHYSSHPSSTSDFDARIIEKKQQQKQIYMNRMRYSHEVNVYEERESEIQIKNMGYCIVTYSTLEEAQNCYFNERFTFKMSLFDSKKIQEFEIDDGFRKRILRFIDSEYRKSKEVVENSKTATEKQNEEYFNQLSLFEKLVDMETQEKSLKEKFSEFTAEEPEVMLSNFRTRVNEIKRDLGQKMGSKSFDELVEEELFGRQLPKTDSGKPKLSLDILPEQSQDVKEMLAADKMKRITSNAIKKKERYYKKLKTRSSKRLGEDSIQPVDEQAAEQTAEEIPEDDVVDDEYTGQRGFSTIKKRAVHFRPRTALEQANYILRYCEYVRNIINEYLGIFSESRLKPNLEANGTFLNPERLRFSDGTEYITEDDLPKFLQCLRSQQKAQQTYTFFWKNYEIFKSRGVNINEYKHNLKNNIFQATQRYTDLGMIKQVYQIDENQDINAKLTYLNATIAGFGEEFRLHQDQNGSKVIVKVNKIDHIAPLDRLNKISQAKEKLDQIYEHDAEKQKLFEKYKYQMLETGEIPEEIRKEFNIPADKNMDSLFEQLAAETGIYKKDIEMLMNLDNFTESQIAEDIGLQVELEKARIGKRQSKASDYAKDPSNIAIRDKEGYFKVSKFRQI